jgi:hypothetical protein
LYRFRTVGSGDQIFGGAAPRVLNAIAGQATWWLIGAGVFLFTIAFVLLAFHLRSTRGLSGRGDSPE